MYLKNSFAQIRSKGGALALALVLALAGSAYCADDPEITSAQALQQAQRRLKVADDNLKRGRSEAGGAQARLRTAQEAYDQAVRKLDEANSRLSSAKQEMERAKAAEADAQRVYDQARAVIEQIYRARQGPGQ